MENLNYKVIKLEGSLDTHRASQTETSFYAKIGTAQQGKDIVVVDLIDVTFLSSLGLRLLFTTAKLLKKRSIPLLFLQPSANIALTALELSGIKSAVPWFVTLEEAKETFHTFSKTE